MMLATAIVVEVILIAIFAMALKHRNRFVSHYPEFKKFYDYGILAFITLAVSKGVFLLLDLEDNGVLKLSQEQSAMINSAGNLLLLIALLMYILGWVRLINVLTEKYEIVPVIEFADGKNHEALKPGLYLCNLPNCYPVIAKLLRGRAGLIVSRHPPEIIKKNLKIEKTPILWLTKVRDRNVVFPTRLEFLLQTMVDFMKKTEDPKVIFLDGLEYLILENGFQPVFKFLTTIKDYAILNNTIVVVPLDEKTLDKRELTILGREFQKLGLKTKI